MKQAWVAAIVFSAVCQATTITYQFTGDCDVFQGNCVGKVAATLVLQNYTPGDDAFENNFVSFQYKSSKFTFSADTSGFFRIFANFPAVLPATAEFDYRSTFTPGECCKWNAATDGTWGLQDGFVGDTGVNGVWSLAAAAPTAAAPEPGTAGLMVVAASLLAFGRIRRG